MSSDISAVERTCLPIIEQLTAAGFTMAPATGTDREGWRVDARGTRLFRDSQMEAVVGSVSWRIDMRDPRLLLQLDDGRIVGEATIGHAHGEIPGVASLVRHLRGAQPRFQLGEPEFDRRYVVESPSLAQARLALPDAVRAVLTRFGQSTVMVPSRPEHNSQPAPHDGSTLFRVQITPGRIELRKSAGVSLLERHVVEPMLRLAEELVAALG